MQHNKELAAIVTIMICILEAQTEEAIRLFNKIPTHQQTKYKYIIKKLRDRDRSFKQLCMNLIQLTGATSKN